MGPAKLRCPCSRCLCCGLHHSPWRGLTICSAEGPRSGVPLLSVFPENWLCAWARCLPCSACGARVQCPGSGHRLAGSDAQSWGPRAAGDSFLPRPLCPRTPMGQPPPPLLPSLFPDLPRGRCQPRGQGRGSWALGTAGSREPARTGAGSPLWGWFSLEVTTSLQCVLSRRREALRARARRLVFPVPGHPQGTA